MGGAQVHGYQVPVTGVASTSWQPATAAYYMTPAVSPIQPSPSPSPTLALALALA